MEETTPKVTEILGVRISCMDMQGLMDLVHRWAKGAKPETIYYVNAHCMNLASQDPVYAEALNSADLVYADGISIVWASKLLRGCSLEKMTGADWIDEFCAMAERERLRMYILAGDAGVAERASLSLIKRFPGLTIVGTTSGYINSGNEQDVLQAINAATPHVLFVGMGTSLQERWIHNNRELISAPVCWAVGALFDYVAGEETRAPNWVNKAGLEWLWRLMVDPKGKWKRYLLGNPLFMSRVVREWLRKS